MNQLREALKDLPAIPKDWRWVTQSQQHLRPCVMRTSHLHHCMVMLWHHYMPEDARIRAEYRRYDLGRTRQEAEYHRCAVVYFLQELAARDDLEPWMAYELEKIGAYLATRPLNLSAPVGTIEHKETDHG